MRLVENGGGIAHAALSAAASVGKIVGSTFRAAVARIQNSGGAGSHHASTGGTHAGSMQMVSGGHTAFTPLVFQTLGPRQPGLDPKTGQFVPQYYSYENDGYFTDVRDPDGGTSSSPIRDGLGRKVTTSVNPQTGEVTTRYEADLGDGTVTESTTLKDGSTVAKVTRRDGTVVETTHGPGNVVVTKTTKGGQTTTEVTGPDGKKTTLDPKQNPTRDGTQPIVGALAAGKSIDEIASDTGLSREQVIAQLRAAGYDVPVPTVPTGENGDVRTTTVRDPVSGKTWTEYYDFQHGRYHIEVKQPDGSTTSSAERDELGRKVAYSTDQKTGGVTTRYEDDLGDGSVFASTRLPDGTVIETTTAKGGQATTVVIAPDGKRTTLAPGQQTTRGGAQPIVEDLAQGKSIDQIANERGLTRDQLIAQLQAAGVSVREISPNGDRGGVDVVEKGNVIASYRYDDKRGTQRIHYIDANGNDITHARGPHGTKTDTVVEANGRKTVTTTALDGKKTVDTTFNGYTLTTAADGSKTIRDDTTGAVLQIKKGSVEETFANMLMAADPKSSNPAEAKKAQVIVTFISGIFAGQALPQLIKAAQDAGVTKDQLIKQYGGLHPAEPIRDGDRIIDLLGNPPKGKAPSGGKWVPVQIDNQWYWVDPKAAQAIYDEQIALTKAHQASKKAQQSQDQLDVYALDPAYNDATKAAQRTIDGALRPFQLRWVPPKPEGTLADARTRLATTTTLLGQITGARKEYETAKTLLTTAISQWNTVRDIPDLTKPGAWAQGSNPEAIRAQAVADQARVKALFWDVGVHTGQGDQLTLHFMIVTSGTTTAPADTLAPGTQPVEITVGGQTIKVSPDVKKKFEAGGIQAIIDSGKAVAIEIETTNADGSQTKQWLWVSPKLAMLEIEADNQHALAGAYQDFFTANVSKTSLESQQVDLRGKLLAEYNEKKGFGKDPDAEYSSIGGKYYGKFVGQRYETRNGQLWVINEFEKGTQEEQLTYAVDNRRVGEEFRNRSLNRQWQELMGGDPAKGEPAGLLAAETTQTKAGLKLNTLKTDQLTRDIADLDRIIPGLRDAYNKALTQYGPGSVAAPDGTIPEGSQPVEVTVGNTKIKVAPDVAALMGEHGLNALTMTDKLVWIEIPVMGHDGTTHQEGRWVDPHLALAKLRYDTTILERDGKQEFLEVVEPLRKWYELRLTHPELLADSESTVEETYLNEHQKLALDSIYQPQFQSFYENGYDNTYKEYDDGHLKALIAEKLGYDKDGDEVKRVFDEIRAKGGAHAKVKLVPIINVSESGSMPMTLFVVQDKDDDDDGVDFGDVAEFTAKATIPFAALALPEDDAAEFHYVDATGRSYKNLEELQDNNTMFAEGSKLVVPVNLEMSPDGDDKIELQVVNARNVSVMDRVVDPIIGIGTGVATVLSFTPAAPVAAPIAFAGGAYFAGRAAWKERRYLETGGEWGDTQSLMNIGMFATSVLPMAASGLRFVGMARNLNIGTRQAFLASIGAVRPAGPVNATAYDLAGDRMWRTFFPHASQVGNYLGSAGGVNKAAYVLDAGAIATGTPLMAYSAGSLVAYGDEMTGLQLLDSVTGLATGFAGTMAGARNTVLYARNQRAGTMRLRDTGDNDVPADDPVPSDTAGSDSATDPLTGPQFLNTGRVPRGRQFSSTSDNGPGFTVQDNRRISSGEISQGRSDLFFTRTRLALRDKFGAWMAPNSEPATRSIVRLGEDDFAATYGRISGKPEKDAPADGFYDPGNRIIYMRDNSTGYFDPVNRQTLGHEMLHDAAAPEFNRMAFDLVNPETGVKFGEVATEYLNFKATGPAAYRDLPGGFQKFVNDSIARNDRSAIPENWRDLAAAERIFVEMGDDGLAAFFQADEVGLRGVHNKAVEAGFKPVANGSDIRVMDAFWNRRTKTKPVSGTPVLPTGSGRLARLRSSALGQQTKAALAVVKKLGLRGGKFAGRVIHDGVPYIAVLLPVADAVAHPWMGTRLREDIGAGNFFGRGPVLVVIAVKAAHKNVAKKMSAVTRPGATLRAVAGSSFAMNAIGNGVKFTESLMHGGWTYAVASQGFFTLAQGALGIRSLYGSYQGRKYARWSGLWAGNTRKTELTGTQGMRWGKAARITGVPKKILQHENPPKQKFGFVASNGKDVFVTVPTGKSRKEVNIWFGNLAKRHGVSPSTVRQAAGLGRTIEVNKIDVPLYIWERDSAASRWLQVVGAGSMSAASGTLIAVDAPIWGPFNMSFVPADILISVGTGGTALMTAIPNKKAGTLAKRFPKTLATFQVTSASALGWKGLGHLLARSGALDGINPDIKTADMRQIGLPPTP